MFNNYSLNSLGRNFVIYGIPCSLLLILMLLPSLSFAVDFNGDLGPTAGEFGTSGNAGALPYDSFLEKLKDSISGPFAGAVSLIGIVVAGAVLIFGGDLNGFFRSLVFLVLVISVIVSGSSIISGIQGSSAEVVIAESLLINS